MTDFNLIHARCADCRNHDGADSFEKDGRTYHPWTADSVTRVHGPADDVEPFHVQCLPWNRIEDV